MKMVQLWFTNASRDLRAAQNLKSLNDGEFYGHCAFWCQQSIEKSIKGYLAFHRIRFTKIHILKKLVKLTEQTDHDLKSLKIDLARITEFAVGYRYPDAEIKPITKEELEHTLVLTQNVFAELVKIALPGKFPLNQ